MSHSTKPGNMHIVNGSVHKYIATFFAEAWVGASGSGMCK